MEFQEVALEDIATLTVGFVGKTATHYVEKGTGIRFLRSMNVEPFRINFDDEKFVDEPFHRKIIKSELCAGDLVIVRTGKPGACAVIPSKDDEWNCSDLVIIKPDHNRVYSLYLAAYINLAYGVINAHLVGAVQQHFNVGAAKRLRIKLPSIENQRRIAELIEDINNKIEINNQINRNLLEQLHTIISERFCYGIEDLPIAGWRKHALSELASFIGGYSYKSSELVESNIAMATIKNFQRQGGFKTDGYKEIAPSPKCKPEHEVQLFDILVAHTDLTQKAEVAGNAEIILSLDGYDKIIMSMDLVKVVPNEQCISKYLLAALLADKRFKDHCLGYVNGSTVLHLSKSALKEYSLVLPEDLRLLSDINSIAESIYKRIAINYEETARLEKLRDTLLPKLMSGEIDVSDIEL